MTRLGFLAAAMLLSLPAAAQQPSGQHMQHGQGMDHSQMQGMGHSHMQGTEHSHMQGMDHSQMRGSAPQGQQPIKKGGQQQRGGP